MKIVSLFILLLSSISFAGAESHGGGAFVCRDKDGALKPSEGYSVELQDIWEGKNFYRLPIYRDEVKTWEQQIGRALDRLEVWNSSLYQKIYFVGNYMFSHRVNIPKGTAIAAPHDANSQIVKKNCNLEGIASFDEMRGDLLLDPTLVAALPVTDYAALMMHESLYKVLRETGETNSVRARHFTAFLFSEAPIITPWQGVPPGSRYCETGDKKIALALFKENGNLWAQLDRVEGYRLMGIARKQIVTNSSAQGPLLQQLFEGQVDEIGIQQGLDGSDSAHFPEIIQFESSYEKYAFILGVGAGYKILRCQNWPL